MAAQPQSPLPAAAGGAGAGLIASTSTNPPLRPAALQPPPPPPPLSQQPPLTSSQHAGPHLLSLKVMRASAPSLAVSEKPYYESHHQSSPNPLISAVGKGIFESLATDPLSNHLGSTKASASQAGPSTFPISNLLTLPSSFGNLFLGETFRTYLCVRNESSSPVREPSLRVEMQVGSSETEGRWHQLSHLILPSPTSEEDGKPVWELAPSAPLETSLGYDIKDLGPHVLVCTVGYKALVEGGWVERSFRKFYKFSVDRSPISVRTKVHQPRHAGSLYHPKREVRERVELEVQVQNVSGGGAGLVFTGLTLRPAEGWGWESIDRPSLTSGEEKEGDMWINPNGGSNEVLSDGDIRQYLFSLTPKEGVRLGRGIDLGMSAEGHVIRGDALGNLDIGWRMSLGEPGRLQTSQLVRRRVVQPLVNLNLSNSADSVLAPKFSAELILLPSALEALKKIQPGGEVELGVKVVVRDVSGSQLPPPPSRLEAGKAGGEKEEEGEDEDDDDTPLSQIASSPRSSRRNTATSLSTAPSRLDDLEPIFIRRTLRVALQHCSILPPPPPSLASTELLGEGGPSTPRKTTPLPTGTPSRTSTPTQTPAVALDKAKLRLQANITNFVRGGSLSLRPGRGSVEVGTDDASGSTPGISRGGTPQPPPAVPSKSLAPPAALGEAEGEGEGEKYGAEGKRKEEGLEYPDPTLSWSKVQELYSNWTESNSQAITRPPPAGSNGTRLAIPESFLPTPELVAFQGTSLTPLPPIHVQLNALRSKSTRTVYRTHENLEGQGEGQGEGEGKLSFAITNHVLPGSVVRFGPLRVLLLGWRDEAERKENGDESKCIKTLLETPVFAEALIAPY